MGFGPHHEAEFGCGVVAIAALVGVLIPVSQLISPPAGAALMAIPLVLLVGWSAWTWYRIHRG